MSESKAFYEAEAERRDVWSEDRRSNEFYQEMSRYDQILKRLPRNGLGTQRVADLGCGDGYLSHLIAARGFVVGSVDLSRARLRRLREHVGGRSVSAHLADLENLAVADGSFEHAVMSEVLEHLERFEPVLAEVRRVLKPGGRLLVTVPFDERLRYVTCPRCLHRFHSSGHVNSFNRENLPRALRQAGFHVEEIATFRSRITNQLQYHLRIPYGRSLRLLDRLLTVFRPDFVFYMLIRARKTDR
jgi:SAM-dependent methyltransferase